MAEAWPCDEDVDAALLFEEAMEVEGETSSMTAADATGPLEDDAVEAKPVRETDSVGKRRRLLPADGDGFFAAPSSEREDVEERQEVVERLHPPGAPVAVATVTGSDGHELAGFLPASGIDDDAHALGAARSAAALHDMGGFCVADEPPQPALARSMESRPSVGPPPGAAAAEASPASSASKSPVDALIKRFAELCTLSPASSSGAPLFSGETQGGSSSSSAVCHQTIPSLAHAKVPLHGVEVLFPFREGPMKPQWQLMERSIEALKEARHAILESPTGTGKTAAMLCAVLAWQRQEHRERGKRRQVMYLSRTHAQLRQVIAELRRTPYRPKVAVLGSRESGLCIHPEVMEVAQVAGGQSSVRQTCRKLRQTGKCSYHLQLAQPGYAERALEALRGDEPWDIEDAAAFGQSACGCPYYTAHSLAQHAELVFCPYNYVFDPSVRRSAGSRSMDLTDKVVVIDEAHNIEGVCRDAGSVDITLDHLQAILSALKRLGARDAPSAGGVPRAAPGAATGAKAPVPKSNQELGGFLSQSQLPASRIQYFDNDPPWSSGADDGQGQGPPRRLPQRLSAGVNALSSLFARLASFLSGARDTEVFAPHLPFHQQVPALLRRLNLHEEPLLRHDPQQQLTSGGTCNQLVRGELLLQELQRHTAANHAEAAGCAVFELASSMLVRLASVVAQPDLYAAYLQAAEKSCLSLWLMAPEGTLAPLAHSAHCLLLMSGTLAPVGASLADLGPGLLQRATPPLDAGHVIPRRALRTLAVAATGSTKLECNFKNWKSKGFLEALGRCVASLAKVIPAGILVFVPNYDVLERCIEAWRTSGAKRSRGAVERIVDGGAAGSGNVWQDILAAKGTVVIEPRPQAGQHGGEAYWGMDAGVGQSSRAAQAFQQAKSEYEAAVRNTGKALLLAVYRGRMSEGVSFEDDFARGVVCIGIPFPALKDEKLVQKRLCNNFWQRQGQGLVSGDAWYEMRALQAVAQALGRCIRHPRDFGALVLLDSRWMELGKAEGLPKWLQPFLEECPDSSTACTRLVEHFRSLAEAQAAALPPATVEAGRLPESSSARAPTAGPEPLAAAACKLEVKEEVLGRQHLPSHPTLQGAAAATARPLKEENALLKQEKKEEESDSGDDVKVAVKTERLEIGAGVPPQGSAVGYIMAQRPPDSKAAANRRRGAFKGMLKAVRQIDGAHIDLE